MDPVTGTIAAIGLGLKLFGGMNASKDASQEAQLSGQNAGYEGQINDQRAQQMELSAYRGQLQDIRNTQRARAMGINAAVNQGAQYGSGMQGGIADVENQGNFNLQGITQNLQIGRNIFGLDSKISQNNVGIANLKGNEATAQGEASLGGSILSSAGTLGTLTKTAAAGFGNMGGMFMGGGSPSGYGNG